MSVIHRAIHIEGLKALRAGVDQENLQLGLRRAFEAVEEHLKCRAQMVSTIEEIAQVYFLNFSSFRNWDDSI